MLQNQCLNEKAGFGILTSITVKRLLLLLIFSVLIVINAFGNTERQLSETEEKLALPFLFLLIITFIIYVSADQIFIGRMSSLMKKKSNKSNIEPIKHKSNEVTAKNKLMLTEINIHSELNEAKAIREIMISQAKAGFNKLLFTDLIVIAVYFIFGYLAHHSFHPEFDGVYGSIYSLTLSFLLLWNIMRFIGHRHQFKAYHNRLFGIVKPFWKFIFWPFQTRWCLLLSFVIIYSTLLTAIFTYSWLLVVAVLFHIVMIYRLKILGRETPNLKLLILRVFAQNKTSTFTFSGLVNFWKHFGSYFTVADPVFYKINWKKKYNYFFPIFIIISSLLLLPLVVRYEEEQDTIILFGGSIFLMVAFLIFFTYSVFSMKRKFISSENNLEERIDKLKRWPKDYENTFKELPVLCFDNTWKNAVNVLSKTADVIMMDLRGFSDENKGCEYEVDFLFDNVTLSRIVFVANDKSVDAVKKLIKERWKMLLNSSPNLNNKSPKASLYITSSENEKEIQGIIDILLLTSTRKFD